MIQMQNKESQTIPYTYFIRTNKSLTLETKSHSEAKLTLFPIEFLIFLITIKIIIDVYSRMFILETR